MYYGYEMSVYKKSLTVTCKAFFKIWHRPTLPRVTAVPSALVGLTSLFGMGRGGHHRYRHLNVCTVQLSLCVCFFMLSHTIFEYVFRFGWSAVRTFLVSNNDMLLKEVSLKNKQQCIALESFGWLVLLDYAVTSFTSVTYQRSSLLRSYMEFSSRG